MNCSKCGYKNGASVYHYLSKVVRGSVILFERLQVYEEDSEAYSALFFS